MRRGDQGDHHGACASVQGDCKAWTGGHLDHSSEIKREACNEPISRPRQCLSPARYSRGLLLWALFLYQTKQAS